MKVRLLCKRVMARHTRSAGESAKEGLVLSADLQVDRRVDLAAASMIAPCPGAIPRVVIYSNHPIMAHGLGTLVVADPALELAACCQNVAALRNHLAEDVPDLAVLDVTPEITIAALSELQHMAPQCKLILWTDSIAGDFAVHALTIGIRGILGKSLSLEAHRQCLHRVYSGQLWFERTLTESLRGGQRVLLTARESQLVSLLSRGLKNKEISCQLGLTEGTVKVYLSHLLHKSGAKDRFELAVQGLKNLHLAGNSPENEGGLRYLMMDPLRRE